MIYGKEKEVDYLAGSKPSNVIPAGTPLNEMVYYIVEDSEKNFNEIMKGIGINELDYFIENGKEIDYSAINEADGDKAKSRIGQIADDMIKWIQQGWAAMQAAIQHALDWLADKASELKKNLRDISEKAMKERVDVLKPDKSFGKTYKYEKLNDYMGDTVKGYNAHANALMNRFDAAMNSEKADEKTLHNLSNQLDVEMKDLIQKVCGKNTDVTEVSQITKAIKKDIRGDEFEVKGSWVKENWNEILNTTKNYSSQKRKLKKDYDDVKKEYNNAITYCKKQKDKKSKLSVEAFVQVNKARKSMLRTLTIAENATISCMSEQYRFYSSIVTRIAASAAAHAPAKAAKNVGSKVASKVKRESAVSTVDMLNSLFEW